MSVTDARRDITDLIVFYTARGWDWLMAVAYLSDKAVTHG